MGIGISSLRPDEIGYPGNLGSIHKSTLDAGNVISLGKQHISATDQLIGTLAIEDGPGVYLGGYPKSDPRREVCLYDSRNNVDRWALVGNNQMYPNGPGQLCQSGNGGLYLFPGRHDQIGKLVYYQNYIGQEHMALIGIQFPCFKFGVIFLYITDHGHF